MKTITKIISGTVAVMFVGLIASSSVSAYRGDGSVQGPERSPERHSEIMEAMDGNDYEAWSKLMENRGRITEIVNEENFSKFVEIRKLDQEGEHEGANAIREELGLRIQDGARLERGKGMMNEGHGQRRVGR